MEGRDSVNEFWQLMRPINLKLWFKDFENSNLKNLGYADIHEWTGDIMHDPPLIGRPISFMVILSERVKDYLQELDIPSHQFHQFNVIKEDDQEERIYYGLQVVNEIYSRLVYSEITFTLEKRKEIIKTYDKGEIGSYKDYLAEQAAMRERFRLSSLKPDKLVYKEHFDLLLNDEARFVVSQKVRNTLLQMDLSGVEITKYDKKEIITGFD